MAENNRLKNCAAYTPRFGGEGMIISPAFKSGAYIAMHG